MTRLIVDSKSAERLKEFSALMGESIDSIVDSALDALAAQRNPATKVTADKIFIKGKTGLKYAFRRFNKGDELPALPGVFYIAGDDSTPIYFERTDNLLDRINELVKDWKSVDLTPYTRFHIRGAESFCKLMVEDLVEEWNPRCKEIDSLKQFFANM